ncbi:hypothetical protein GS399_14165 [Pedobacter sp. HMF7647]|uniref:DUF4252 domain-containing protein n=1 Tax=Hufsiella arboris TaxID=2695275 RepID=A0A7K1YDF3_9SPHI|nr:hypothetical protein [Hufsiella arboris]MXV52119.1 hypothetical protein [Hufsiella arboris]
MKKLFTAIIALLFLAFNSYSQDSVLFKENPAKKRLKAMSTIVSNMRYQRSIATIPEGHHSFGSRYTIKDILIKGNVSLISVTYGGALSSTLMNSGTSDTFYYILKQGLEDTYQEIFLGETDITYLNNSKSIMKQAMSDEPAVVMKINQLNRLTRGQVKKLIKEYNAKHS